jgi:hypothetical protein
MAYSLYRKRADTMSPIFLPHPIKPPTGEEGSVIFWAIFLVLLGCGAVCLYLGYRAPAEKAKEAGELIAKGYCFLIANVAMLIYRRFFSGYS